MRLFAQVRPDGSVDALVTGSGDEATAMPIPVPGNQVYEVGEHPLNAKKFEPQELAKLHEEYSVDVKPGTARLTRTKNKKTAE
jgi:hypothetical protein